MAAAKRPPTEAEETLVSARNVVLYQTDWELAGRDGARHRTGAIGRDYMAWELETGSTAGLSSALGEGTDQWRLRVSAPGGVEALSLLGLPTGHITNLSTTPRHPPA